MKLNKVTKKFYLRTILLLFLFACNDEYAKPGVTQVDAKTVTADEKSSKAELDSKYIPITFQSLNYYSIMKAATPSPYDSPSDFGMIPDNPNDAINRQVPTDVLKLDGKEIQISGFVYPVKLKLGKTSGFVLMSILPSCCFGDDLKINDIIYVDAIDDLKSLKKDQYVTVKGKLSIGMTEMENGKQKFLYWLKAKKVTFGNPGL